MNVLELCDVVLCDSHTRDGSGVLHEKYKNIDIEIEKIKKKCKKFRKTIKHTPILDEHGVKIGRTTDVSIYSLHELVLPNSEFTLSCMDLFENIYLGRGTYLDREIYILRCDKWEELKFTLSYVRSTLEVLFHQLFDEIKKINVKHFITFMLDVHSFNKYDFVRIAKYCTAWPMAKFLKNDLPKEPEGFADLGLKPLIFKGKIYQILKNRLMGGGKESSLGYCTKVNKKNLTLWCSYLYGIKRGCATVPDSYITSAYVDHWKTMRREPFSILEGKELEEFEERFSQYADRFVCKFKGPSPRLYEPSTSAGHKAPFAEGGQRKFIREELKENKGFWKFNFSLGEDEDGEVSQIVESKFLLESNDLVAMKERGPGELYSFYGESAPTFKAAMEAFFDVDVGDGDKLVLDATTYAIPEPLKVRMITKGEPFPYWISKFFQKGLWDYLRKYEMFLLIGEKLQLRHLRNMVDKADNIGLKFDSFVSGDYSAATDKLNINFTKACFEAFLKKTNYSDELKDLLRAVLYEHEIHYPKKTELPSVTQRNGQLMGSPLSFPILCMCNMICYHMSLETLLGRKVPFSDLPVLINGDDILFPSNPELYAIWRKNVATVGFELSVGKNYVHTNVLTVNSECFVYHYGTKQFTKMKFLNCGLLTGQSKKGGSASDRSDQTIDSIYNELIANSPNKLRSHNRFLFYFKDIISKYTKVGSSYLNLFIDRNLGGLGFINEDVKVNFTKTQRLLAAYLEHDIKEKLSIGSTKFSRFKVIKDVYVTTPLSKSYQKVILKSKYQPLNIGDFKFKSPDPLFKGILREQNFTKDMFNDESGLTKDYKVVLPHIPYGKLKAVCNEKNIYPISSDSRITNWPMELISTKNHELLYDISYRNALDGNTISVSV